MALKAYPICRAIRHPTRCRVSAWAAMALAAACLGALPALGQDRDGDLRVRAKLVAKQRATLSSNLDAQIARLTVELGQRFAKGDVLVQFDCRRLVATARRAQAELRAATATWRAKSRLVELRAAGKLELDLAVAEREKAAASLQEIEARVSDCEIAAPFAGRVAKLHAEPFETVSTGKPLVDIVGQALEIQILVPGGWLRWLKAGTVFKLNVEETGRIYDAEVFAIGARVDTGSQRIEVVGRLRSQASDLLAGMSGAARFERPADARR